MNDLDMTNLDPRATLPLSRELNAEIARKIDDACKARELAQSPRKLSTRCCACGRVIDAKQTGAFDTIRGLAFCKGCAR
jgi:hypothetical protein